MTNLSASIAELKTLVGQTETELKSLLSGKKASAPRVRASLQKIKTVSHSMRASVMDHVKALPVNSRAKKPVEDELPPPPPVLEREVTEAPEPVKKPKRVRKKTIKQEATE
jgi:type IV secretory pathway VirB10-like protein